MDTEVAIKEPPSIIQDMAIRFGMDKRAFEATLKATVVPANVSNEQFVAFLLVAKQYNLNPITKEIYAFPAKSGGIQPIVGIDGWCNIINSHPQANGWVFEDKLDDKGKIISITCKIYRKDREHPIECTEYMSECYRDTGTWKQWPARMLRHKALIQCARYAFGFSGIVEQDEAERQDMIDVTHSSISPTTGVLTAKSAYGSAKAMKTRWNEITERITTSKTPEELDGVLCNYKADLSTMKAIEEQMYNNLMVIANNRSVAFREEEIEESEEEVVPAFIRDMDAQLNSKLA